MTSIGRHASSPVSEDAPTVRRYLEIEMGAQGYSTGFRRTGAWALDILDAVEEICRAHGGF
jgi:hypothetical protein